MGFPCQHRAEKYGLISAEIRVIKTRVTSKGRIVIPVELRRKYGIKAGTKIIISTKDNLIILKPMTDQYLKKLQGSLRGTGALKVLIEEHHQEYG